MRRRASSLPNVKNRRVSDFTRNALGHHAPKLKLAGACGVARRAVVTAASEDAEYKDGATRPLMPIPTPYRVTADELRQFIERIERLDAEKKDLAEQQKEVMAEAKARGYDTKVMRKVIALRKRDKDDIAEEEAVLEMYKEALGMA